MTRELSELCKLISADLLDSVYAGLEHIQNIDQRVKIDNQASDLARFCGYHLVDDKWVLFPRQKATIDKLCPNRPTYKCKLMEQHGDGDITLKVDNDLFVVTIDGKAFKQIEV